MSLPELDQEFRTLAQEPLDLGAVRASILHGFARRQRRRRTTALAASLAAVVVVAVGIGVVRQSGITSAPVAAVPNWQENARPVVIPAESTLTRYAVRDVVSPVTATVDAPAAGSTVEWRQDVDTFYVAWQNPAAAGIATARTAGGSKRAPAEMTQRAWVITKTPNLPRWQLLPDTDHPATTSTQVPTRARASVVIGGHRAGIVDDMQSAFAVTGETRWATWQLTDGQWVHAWVRTAGDSALIAFANGIVETPTTFSRHLTVGGTAPGYTVEGGTEVGATRRSAGGEVWVVSGGYHDNLPGTDPTLLDGDGRPYQESRS